MPDAGVQQRIPSGSRAFVMKNIIHDWNDAQACEILRNCRRAVPDDGVLLLIEYGLGEDNTPSVGKMVDLVMLTITGGKERTVDEHRALLASYRSKPLSANGREEDAARLPAGAIILFRALVGAPSS